MKTMMALALLAASGNLQANAKPTLPPGGSVPEYYWRCPNCGFTHYGADIPELE